MHQTIIKAETLHAQLGNPDWVIVDCRASLADLDYGRRAYAERHIPGAVHAHLEEDLSGPIIKGATGRHPLPTVEALSAKLAAWGIGEGVQVVVYDDRSGGIAARLWWMLRWLGHDAVAVLEGGWQGWLSHEFPTSDISGTPKARTFQAHPRPDMLVDVAGVEAIREDARYKLVDSREQARYEGREEPIDPIAGHIPGAVNLPFAKHLDANGHFAPKETLRENWLDILGDTAPQEAVVYCGSGVTACFNLLVMAEAGLDGAKLYPGSWSDWIADPARPIGKSA